MPLSGPDPRPASAPAAPQPRPVSDLEGRTRPVTFDGTEVVERLADFQAGAVTGAGDLEALPDAVVPDSLVAYALGPVALGDATEGIEAYVWRARISGDQVLLSREADDAWGAESALFEVGGAPAPDRVALTFEQAGRAVVALERAGNVWIYHFDPDAAAFVLEDFGAGRCVRAIYDDPPDSTAGDAQVFYLNAAHVLCHRQQRSRYAVEVETPYAGTEHSYLLGLARTQVTRRLVAVLAVRDDEAGTYQLTRLESEAFPHRPPAETLDLSGVPTWGRLQDMPFPTEALDLSGYPVSGLLRDLIQVYAADEALNLSGYPTLGLLRDLVQVYAAEAEGVDLSGYPVSGTLIVVAVLYSAPAESLNLSGYPTSGTLV